MDPEERSVIRARINDAIVRCEQRCRPEFVGFIDRASAYDAVTAAKKAGCSFMLYGGYEEAERCFFGAFPSLIEPDASLFPVVRIKIVNKSRTKFSHRDILGALMSLGIERDTVGDILAGERVSVIFVHKHICDFVVLNLTKIASCGVEASVDTDTELPFVPSFEEHTDTVASPRLDCVVAAAVNTSRGKATELIASGTVLLNGIEALRPDKTVKTGDILVVRHFGKFIADGLNDTTRKGRIIFKYRKYL